MKVQFNFEICIRFSNTLTVHGIMSRDRIIIKLAISNNVAVLTKDEVSVARESHVMNRLETHAN